MYTYEKKDKQGQLNISVTAQEWNEAVEAVYEKTKGKYKVQGFRQGKVPRKVIEQNYGDTVFFDDAFDEIISGEWEAFASEGKVKIASHPHVLDESFKFSVSDGVKVSLVFDLMPEVKLGDWSKIKVKREKVSIEPSDVDREVERLKEKHARFVEVDEAAHDGDFATIDFSGSIDGVKFEGGTAEDYRLELGSHTFIEGFEEQVVGLKKGDTKDVKVTFPENYHAENLKGKPAVFAVTVKRVDRKQLPEIDDKFISDTTEFETLAEYKENLSKTLKEQAEQRADQAYETALVDAVADNATIEIPQSMIDHEIHHIMEDFEHRLSHEGMKIEDYLGYMGKTMEEFRAERADDATKNVRTRLVLQSIVEENNFTATEEEIEQSVKDYTERYNLTYENLKDSLTPQEHDYFENSVVMGKVLNFIKSKVKA